MCAALLAPTVDCGYSEKDEGEDKEEEEEEEVLEEEEK